MAAVAGTEGEAAVEEAVAAGGTGAAGDAAAEGAVAGGAEDEAGADNGGSTGYHEQPTTK